MPNRSGYQPLSQSLHEETDVGEGLSGPSQPSSARRITRPGNIDLTKLDNAFKRLVKGIFNPLSLTQNFKQMD
jgi:phosphatidylinositol 4-kinase type 2